MDLKAYDVYRFHERLEFMSIVIRELARISHMEIEIWNNCFKISVVPNNTISNIMVLRVKRNDPVSEYLIGIIK